MGSQTPGPRLRMHRSAVVGLVAGLAGMTGGLLSAMLDSPVLAALAGAAALAAGGASVSLVDRLHEAEARAQTLASAAQDATHAADGQLLDAETGLPDEWFFQMVLEGRLAVARKQLQPLTVVLFDLQLADQAPDGALGDFASQLRSTLRESDITCRTGSTAFGMLLEHTREDGGAFAAERVKAGISPTIGRIAAGVASYPAHAFEAEDLVGRARDALERAVSAADGRVEVA